MQRYVEQVLRTSDIEAAIQRTAFTSEMRNQVNDYGHPISIESPRVVVVTWVAA